MIRDLLLNPLGPSLILALGGLLLLPLSHRGPTANASRARLALPLATLFVLLAGVLLIVLRRGQPGIASAAHWAWQPLTVAGSALAWHMDGWNWLAAALLVCIAAAALALQGDASSDPSGPARAGRTLWLAAAGLAFVFSDNVVTLATCWVALDAMLLLRLRPDQSARPAARTWSLLSLGALVVLAALVFLGEANARATFSAGPIPGPALALLWLAALIRIGTYPFHLWLTGPGNLDTSDRVALYLIGPTAGIWMLARVDLLAGPNWAHLPEWVALGALALLGTALAAWAAPDRQSAWRWVAINRASLVVLTSCVAAVAGPVALVWPLVTFALGAALLALGMALRDRWGWSLPIWLGALVVWGLPGTPGFLARSVLVLPAPAGAVAIQTPLNLMLFGIILMSEVLLVAALWEIVTGPNDPQETPAARAGTPAGFRSPIWRLGTTTVLLAVPVLVWGLWPRQPAMLAGLLPGSGLPLTLAQAVIEARRSVWAGLIAAGIGGALLGWLRPQIFTGMRGWQEAITGVVSLEWVYRSATLLLGLGRGLQYFARLGEGEGYFGWLALATLVLWILLRS
jgi:hypothetical protein